MAAGERRAIPRAPPRHYVPASNDFATSVRLGLGWALLPRFQSQEALERGELVALGGPPVDVPLYWQQWNLRSELLDAVADEIVAEGRRAAAVAASKGEPSRQSSLTRSTILPRVWPFSSSACASAASRRSNTLSM